MSPTHLSSRDAWKSRPVATCQGSRDVRAEVLGTSSARSPKAIWTDRYANARQAAAPRSPAAAPTVKARWNPVGRWGAAGTGVGRSCASGAAWKQQPCSPAPVTSVSRETVSASTHTGRIATGRGKRTQVSAIEEGARQGRESDSPRDSARVAIRLHSLVLSSRGSGAWCVHRNGLMALDPIETSVRCKLLMLNRKHSPAGRRATPDP